MIEQIKKLDGNAVAFEVIDSFTETDGKLAHKIFEEKINEGHTTINVLIKIDRLTIGHIGLIAALQDIAYVFKNLKQFGNLAIVAHSKILKTLVKMDNIFYTHLNKGVEERYFDVSKIEDAFTYVQTN